MNVERHYPDRESPARNRDGAGRSGLELHEGDFRAFFRVPFVAYGPESLYVSPMRSDLARTLDPKRNPLFRSHGSGTWFTVHREGEPVGRIVAHIHRTSNERHETRRGCFGFFDCVDDPGVAHRLFEAAERWLGVRGCGEIAGPFNLTAMQQLGVVTEGFEHAPYTDMQYNPPHIPRLLEEAGFKRFFPMSTFELPLDGFDPERSDAPAAPEEDGVSANGLRWVPLRRRGYRKRLEDIRALLNESFDRNPMFVPLTREEFLFQAGEMMWIIDERLPQLVCRGSRAVGAVICIPDLNPFLRSMGSRLGPRLPLEYLRHLRTRRRAVIIFWAVHPSMWGQGLNPAMVRRLIGTLKDAGYRELGLTWIADPNRASLRQIEKLGARRLHRLHLFRKPIQPVPKR